MRLGSTGLVFCAVALAACGGSSARATEQGKPAPAATPDSVSIVRGTADAAGLVSDEDQLQIVGWLLRNVYYPADGKARWFDPRPLAHVRVPAQDDTVGADPDFADEAVRSASENRTCVLNYRDFGCRGKAGTVLRFSWPYRIEKDSAVVFVTTAPRDSTGKIGNVESEIRYRMKWNRDGYWELKGKTTVFSAKPSPSARRP